MPRLEHVLPIFLLAGLSACSGAAESDLFDPATDRGATEPAGPSSDAPPSVAKDGDRDDDPEPGPRPAPPLPGEPPAEPPPKEVCQQEAEPNDRVQQASPFDGCVAGIIDGSDTDHVVIVAPANAKTMTIAHETKGGDLSVQVLRSGGLGGFADAPATMEVVAGQPYVFRMRKPGFGGGGDRSYELRVAFK